MVLTLPLEPVAWQRVKIGRYGQSYVPTKTRFFKDAVSRHARASHLGLARGPVMLTVTFFLRRPPSNRSPLPIVRPDLDNYLKAVLDALNGIAWVDDSQVTNVWMRKRYSKKPEGYIEIEIETDEIETV